MQHKPFHFSSYFLPTHEQSAYHLTLGVLLAAMVMLLPDLAYAGADPLTQTLCVVINWFTGPLGRFIATLGIMVLGIGALMGKVSWGAAVTVAIGVSIMFGGAEIVDILVTAPGVTAAGVIASCGDTAAADPGAIGEVLCNLSALANSPTGRALSTLAITFLGVSCLMGKISAGAALVTASGIGVFHGADRIGQIVASAMGGSWASMPGCVPPASPF